MKRCTLNNRHSWAFVKNVMARKTTPRTVSLSQKGLYRCACGAEKLAEPDINECLSAKPEVRP